MTISCVTAATAPDQPVRRLWRRVDGRVVAGVAAGLAEHLRLDVRLVRLAFVLLTFTGGAGAAMYVAFWALAPLAPELETGLPAGGGREAPARERAELGQLLGLGVLGLAAVMVGQLLGIGVNAAVGFPLVVVGLGVVLLWRQADDARRERWRAATFSTAAGARSLATRPTYLVRAALGVALVVTGAALLLAARTSLQQARSVLLASGVVIAGLALMAGPFVLRLVRDLADERAARVREQERAELAAHVHDSVLHTLALIQRRIDDPREVARLARAQERDLRAWLYRPVADPDVTLRAGLERLAGEVEDAHGVAVEVVVVGDTHLDERLRALLLAAREAMVNAAKYAGTAGPISVYGEVEPDQVTVFVRDRGEGFDLEAVPGHRLGVRQSILGRMQRNGGSAVVRSVDGEGTEVELDMPRQGVA